MQKISLRFIAVSLISVFVINGLYSRSEKEPGRIIFVDEFDGDSSIPDTTIWKLCGFAKNAWSQHFEFVEGFENVATEGGYLVLKTTKSDGHYKNGGIRTKRGFPCNSRVSVRARLNKLVKGGFPAIWQMPVDGKEWPVSGEVDIMEWVQKTPQSVYQTVHSSYNEAHSPIRDTGVTNVTDNIDVTEFHVYSADRTPDAVIFYIDGKETGRYVNLHDEDEDSQFPYCSLPFDIILNYSLGGDLNGNPTWPGKIDDNDLPGELIIDWVKVYDLTDTAGSSQY